MLNSLNEIETQGECQGVIDYVVNEISETTFDKVTAEHEGKATGTNSQSVEISLSKATSDLNTVNSVLATIAEGPLKEKQITDQMRLQLRVRTLTERSKDKGALALIKNELILSILDKKLEVLSETKTDLETLKPTLPA